MSKFDCYLIFRCRRRKQDPDLKDHERTTYYGWTQSRYVLEAFLKQRNPDKYIYRKVATEDAYRYQHPNMVYDILDPRFMIDYVTLESAQSDVKTTLFMTNSEMERAELGIQQHFRNLTQFDPEGLGDGDDIITCINLFCNLRDDYGECLYFLGFRPVDIDLLFADMQESDRSAWDDPDGQIEFVYRNISNYRNQLKQQKGPRGLYGLKEVCNKIIYSLESFITYLVDDL